MGFEQRHLQAQGLQRWTRSAASPASASVAPVAELAAPAPAHAAAQPVAAAGTAVPAAAAEPRPAPPAPSAPEPRPAAAPPSPLAATRAAASAPAAGTSAAAGEDADAELAARIAHMDWDTLAAELARRSRPPATQGVFGVGDRGARLFVIGEAPGAEEDRRGEPFVGRAGKLLDAMLGAIGHSRADNTYIANICKFRPPDNRDPRPEEIAQDLPLLLRQIALVQPTLLLAVGRIAAQTLLGSTQPIGRLRGQVHTHPDSGLPLVVTYHPAYLLRSPLQKAKAWDDLKRVRAVLASGG